MGNLGKQPVSFPALQEDMSCMVVHTRESTNSLVLSVNKNLLFHLWLLERILQIQVYDLVLKKFMKLLHDIY
jgi:hypothetical protein